MSWRVLTNLKLFCSLYKCKQGKGTISQDFLSYFLCDSNPSRSCIQMLKYSCIWFRFCEIFACVKTPPCHWHCQNPRYYLHCGVKNYLSDLKKVSNLKRQRHKIVDFVFSRLNLQYFNHDSWAKLFLCRGSRFLRYFSAIFKFKKNMLTL